MSITYPEATVFGTHVRELRSAIVGQDYLLSVMLPPSYSDSHRNRDYIPTAVDDVPGSGGAPQFYRFLRDELNPFIEGWTSLMTSYVF